MSGIAAICSSVRARPAAYCEDLPGQAAFLGATARRVVWFGANGTGKTQALVRRLIRVFEGTDPICRMGKRQLSILLVVTGYDAVSARDFAQQLHDLVPDGLLGQVAADDAGRPVSRASPWYAPGKGFRGRPPRLVVQRGPMRDTVLNVATLGSGAAASAGGTLDLILVNEPVSRGLIDELATRDRAGALGYFWYAFTPIRGAPDQSWAPEWVESQGEQAVYIVTPLTPSALTFPSGRTLESWDAKTAPRIASWLGSERSMRMGESLEPLMEAGFFTEAWDPERHIIAAPPSGADLWLVGSIDHSFRSGRAVVGVTGYRAMGGTGVRRLTAYDLVGIAGDGADYDRLADQFLAALDLANIPLDSIDQWIGDRAAVSTATFRRRDNLLWRGAVLGALRRRAQSRGIAPSTVKAPRPLWSISTPRKRAGSSEYLMSEVRRALAEQPGRLYVLRSSIEIAHEICRAASLADAVEHLAQAIPRWDGTPGAPEKDHLDRLGYSWEMAHRRYGLWREGAA